MVEGDDLAQEQAKLRIQDVKGFTAVLNALKSGSKQQDCAIGLAPDGLRLRWEDESKTLQCSLHIPCEAFEVYNCPQDTEYSFGVKLSTLLDTLAMFAASSAENNDTLELKYPGQHGELLFGMQDGESGPGRTCLVTYARLGCIELPARRDLTDFWQGPASYFLSQGSMLKEVVEDLEWPSGSVTIRMAGEPQQLTFGSSGVPGSLEIDLPTADLMGFSLHAPLRQPAAPGDLEDPIGTDAGPQQQRPMIEHSYRYKAMRAAFCNVPTKEASGVSSKVSIDSNGMLKATHMVQLASASSRMDMDYLHQGTAGTQAPGGGSSAVISFVTVPVIDGDDG